MLNDFRQPRRALAWTMSLCLTPLIAATPLYSATLNIGATGTTIAHLEIGGGNPPSDIDIPPGVPTTLAGVNTSSVDDPTALNTNGAFVQVGNPFTDPPTPYISTRFDQTTQPDGDSARGFYSVESTVSPASDNDHRPVHLERRLIADAAMTFADISTNAEASGGYSIARDLVLTNTSATTAYAFSFTTGFDMNLSASADALGSSSTTTGVFSLSFISSGTVLLGDPTQLAWSSSMDDTDPGTLATGNLVTSNGLFDGVNYQASVTADGTGASTAAGLQSSGLFQFSVLMGAGSSLRLSFFQSQYAQSTYVVPVGAQVPLPASAVLLVAGLGMLGAGAKRRKRR